MQTSDTSASRRHPNAPTLAGLRNGAAAALTVAPGVFFFGAAFGALAAQKGMTLAEAMLMTGLVFAGASQFAAMDVWQDRWTLSGFIAIAAVVGIVNVRMFLMSAALRPWLEGLPARFVYPQFLVLTDVNYVMGARYRAGGGTDAGMLAGAGLAVWAIWTLAALPGYVVGALISDPKRFGFDLIMPIMFAVFIVPLWKSQRDTRDWGIAGVVALALMYAGAGHWHIVGGALAGMLSAAFLTSNQR